MVAGMIRRRWMRWGAVGAVAAVALTGCVGEDEPTPSPTAPSTSAATSEDLAAGARTVYDGFRTAVDALYASPDPDYTTLSDWAVDEVATAEAAAAQDLLDSGITAGGSSTATAFELVEGSVSDSSFAIGVCEDIGGTTFTDANGTDVTPADRDVTIDLLFEFQRRDGRSPLISHVGAWESEGPPPCG